MRRLATFLGLSILIVGLTGCLGPMPAPVPSVFVLGPSRAEDACAILHPPRFGWSMHERCVLKLQSASESDEMDFADALRTVKGWAVARERYKVDPARFHPGFLIPTATLTYVVEGRFVTCRPLGSLVECG